jgi:hypothetical protein
MGEVCSEGALLTSYWAISELSKSNQKLTDTLFLVPPPGKDLSSLILEDRRSSTTKGSTIFISHRFEVMTYEPKADPLAHYREPAFPIRKKNRKSSKLT